GREGAGEAQRVDRDRIVEQRQDAVRIGQAGRDDAGQVNGVTGAKSPNRSDYFGPRLKDKEVVAAAERNCGAAAAKNRAIVDQGGASGALHVDADPAGNLRRPIADAAINDGPTAKKVYADSGPSGCCAVTAAVSYASGTGGTAGDDAVIGYGG